MSFDYKELRARQQNSETQWASYSDLFMVLAFVFLLMYMVSSLRTGMISLTSHAEIQQVKQELEIYETIKDGYLAEQANVLEQKIYQEIIGKIVLLEDEATAKKEKLMQQARQQAERESSLNKYQQMIVSMMNANTAAKAKSVETIASQRQENKNLQQAIEVRAAEKDRLEAALATQTALLESRISDLTVRQQKSRQELVKLEHELSRESAEKSALASASTEEIAELEQKYRYLKGDYELKLGQLTLLQDNIVAGKAQVATLEENYQDKIQDLEGKYAGLKNQYENNQVMVEELEAELGGTRASLLDATSNLDKVESELATASEELGRALEFARYRQDVAGRIRKRFEEAGIDAQVDGETGEVILGFGKEYFETNSHDLKPGMKDAIRDAMPVYADSLFGGDDELASISAIEIIGFASPTFGGRPVDPTSLSARNRTAVNYNLNLSYQRARSIFEYAFDTKTLAFEHQETMLPLIKVTGRSFFTEQINPEDTGNLSEEEFCELYNCTGSQRVIIKFDLKQKENS